jgi:RNA polymerase sigma-70 factor, ECF subfamily
VDGLADFERFCVMAHPRLVAALTHHVGDRWLAEELTQEALVRAGDRWAHVAGLRSPIGWCFRVGANLGTSRFRRRRAERRALERHGARPHLHVDDDTPDRLAVRSALAGLGEAQRRIIVLRYYLRLDGPEAAAVLGIAPAAARQQLHRAVAALRVALDLQPSPEEAHDAV